MLILAVFVGCGGDDTVTIPEGATAEAPDEAASEDGEEKKGPGEEHKLKPR